MIVDYALPENPIASKLVYHLVKLYERDNYAEFVRSDLHAMLNRAGLAARTEARVAPGTAMRWWSPAMIMIASKVEAPTSTGGESQATATRHPDDLGAARAAEVVTPTRS